MAGGDLSGELQNAVVDRLSGDSQLGVGDPARVFDFVPQGEPFPYVQVGDASAVDHGTKTEPGQSISFAFYVFSQSERTNDTINRIAARISTLFHEKPLALDSGECYLARFESAHTRQLRDGITRQKVCLYRFYVSEPTPT